MDTVVTFTVGDALLGLLIIAVIVLVVFLIVAAYNLIMRLKQTKKVLDDLEVVAHISSERAKQLDKLIEDASKKLKSGQNIFSSIPIIVSAATKIAKVVKQKNRPAQGQQKK